MVGWRLSFDARWTWLSNLVVLECVVGERGETAKRSVGIRCVWLDWFNLSCCTGCGERSTGDGHAVVFGFRSDSMQRSGRAVTVSGVGGLESLYFAEV